MDNQEIIQEEVMPCRHVLDDYRWDCVKCGKSYWIIKEEFYKNKK